MDGFMYVCIESHFYALITLGKEGRERVRGRPSV
jgi:hypothetical protein